MSDPRFARLRTDPRFRKPKKHSSKVEIDERFKSVLDNDLSNHKSSRHRVDKYGRKTSSKQDADNLRRFYRLQKEGDTGDDVNAALGPDLARGEVLLESSDESADGSGDSEDEDDGEVILGQHKSKPISVLADPEYPEIDLNEDESVYAELDAQAEALLKEQGEEEQQQEATKTNRLAVVNLDWDHVRASHLYKIFSSLLSSSQSTVSKNRARTQTVGVGKVLNVRVYPSEFGKARMKREEIEGPPKEIFKKTRRGDNDVLLEEDEGDEYDEDALRKYQLERLRYYYAIATCDTVEAAEHIVKELDGTELERSANVFDLSYVPDDMTFDEEFRDEASFETTASMTDYKGLDFSTDALRHSKVKLHWDEDDPERNKVTRRALSLKEIEEENFKALIASSSESSGEEDETSGQSKKNRDKLRALLLDNSDNDLPEGWSRDPFNDSKQGEGDVEITFTPGLSEQKADSENETTLDKYKRKMKEKRLQRKREHAKKSDHSIGDEKPRKSSPVKDDFFGEDSSGSEAETSKAVEQASEDLSMVVGQNPEGKEPKHFNLKAILKAEKETKGKKSKKRNKSGPAEDELQEDFQIDVNDERFKALHEDHTFAIDPSNPHFKKTKSMVALLDERAKRQRSKLHDLDRAQGPTAKQNSGDNLENLVERVKRKSAHGAHSRQNGKRQRV